MYTESDIEAAVAAGALTPDAAAALRNHVASGNASPAVDEENFRLLSGFNDIFVAIAAVLLLSALGWIGSRAGFNGRDVPSPIGPVFVAGAAWGLAEFFTRRRRMALPSIVLLLAFLGAMFVGTAFAVRQILGASGLPDTMIHNLENVQMIAGLTLAICAAVTVAAA